MKLFAPLPQNLADLTVDELKADLAGRRELALQIKNNDLAVCEGMSSVERLEELTAGVVLIESLKDTISELEATEETTAAEIEALTATALEGLEVEGDEPGDGDDAAAAAAEADASLEAEAAEVVAAAEEATAEAAEAEAVEEPVVAAAAIRRPIALPQPTRDREPRDATQGSPMIAAAGVRVVREGGEMNREEMGKATVEMLNANRGTTGKKYVGSAKFSFPEERRLNGSDDAEKILAVVGPNAVGRSVDGLEARVAAGGLCAPLTPIYTIPNFGTSERPVRDSLPSFEATRGGVTYPVPTTLADANGAIGVITEAEDSDGGTYATKPVLGVSCPAFLDATVTAISARRQYGNLGSMAWPEQVAHENDVTLDAHARVAESYLLEQIKQLSLENSSAGVYNAVYDLIYALAKGGASMRFRLRMSRNARLRALLPEYLIDLLLVDLAGTPFDRFKTQAQIEQILRGVGIEPTWYKDSPLYTSAAPFAAEVDNTTEDAFPTAVEIGLFPEGTFIHLDKGQLDFGIVRDSTLNETNDWETFFETFENVARIGPVQAARWIIATLCPNGTFPDLQTALSCA